MSEVSPSDAVIAVWREQHLWSLTANRLKARIDRARKVGLWLAMATAVLAVAAVQITDTAAWAGRALSAAAAITAGIATVIVRQRTGTESTRSWTRARSASEGLKSEIYQRLAGSSKYTGEDRDSLLADTAHEITGGVADLKRLTLGLTPGDSEPPAVTDVDSYITLRVDEQINDYYRPRAATYQQRVGRLRGIGDALGVIAVVFGAVAAAFDVVSLTAWVPVVTTIAAAVAAHIAASRYDHQIIEFLRTADELGHLRDNRRGQLTDAGFVDACEAVISVENQAWMTRWNNPDSTA